MASEGVDPDARCYRFAAEAFRTTGDAENKPSPEAEHFSEIAERLELGVSKEVARGSGSSGGGGGGGSSGSLGEMLSGMGMSGTAELEALLEGAGAGDTEAELLRLDDAA